MDGNVNMIREEERETVTERVRTRYLAAFPVSLSVSESAEREGFEPSVRFKGVQRFSKPALSATQAPLQFFYEWQR